MSNKAQTRIELLHIAHSLLTSGDRHGRTVTADELVAEAEKLEQFVNKKPGVTITGSLLVEGDVKATGDVVADYSRGPRC